MADTTQLELVSPSELLKSEAVEMVVVPGSEGNFGALPKHAPMIATLRPGVLDIYKGGKVEEQIFVAGGLAEVDPERCTILAEEARPVSELSAEDANKRLTNARNALEKAESEHTKTAATAEIAVASAMPRAIGA